MRFLGILAPILCVGCIPYPIYKTLQPPLSITVVDANGDAVPEATAELVANSFPYNLEKSRMKATTDFGGRASFSAEREWRIEAIMLHGAEIFYWNWCVRKEGYVTRHSNFPDDEGRLPSRVEVVLIEGTSVPCPRYGIGPHSNNGLQPTADS